MRPTLLQRWSDWRATLGTNVRVRVLIDGQGQVECVARGGCSKLSAARARALVFELGPRHAGTVDLFAHPRGGWVVKVDGPLHEEGLEQRLRNMLINLKASADVSRLRR